MDEQQYTYMHVHLYVVSLICSAQHLGFKVRTLYVHIHVHVRTYITGVSLMSKTHNLSC